MPLKESSKTADFSGEIPAFSAAVRNTSGFGFPFVTSFAVMI